MKTDDKSETNIDTINDEVSNEDFQYVLKQLVAAYQPILEEELKRAKSLDQLEKEAAANPPNCEEDFALADRLFGNFFNEEIVTRLLPRESREILGPVEQWRWCLLHVRCCLIFGWLICHRRLNFRLYSYYLKYYWRCVREVLGVPVSNPLSAEDRKDFSVLVEALATAFKPYLTDQLATVEFAGGVSDAVLDEKIDCFEGEEAQAAIFERFFDSDIAPALFGREAFEKQRVSQSYWFCRCWCLCALRLGCCLAQAHTLKQVRWCLKFYFLCLRRCFGPLVCKITAPDGCVAEEVNVDLGALVVPIIGTAGGGGFNHYILEWSINDVTYHATDFHYPPIPPGPTVQGNSPVFGGLLAYFDTSFQDPGLIFLRLTVFSATGATCIFKKSFELFKKDVRITGVDTHFDMDTSWIDPAAQFIETVPALCARPSTVEEISFGECLSIQGGAFVGGCDDKSLKRYRLDYKPGFETDCTTGGWIPIGGPASSIIDYNTPVKRRFTNWRTDNSWLTDVWGPDCIPALPGPPPCGPPPWRNVPDAALYPTCWETHTGTCTLSGLYTIRVVVEATDGSTFCDSQRIWIDNKPICALIYIDAVPKCADLFVSKFANPPDCSNAWELPLAGIAYDELIDIALPATRPNDNFDYYNIEVTKQGGPTISIPINSASCFYGVTRVGNPGTVCTPCVPLYPHPGAGTLTKFDLRAVDLKCKASMPYLVPDAFTIPRGECCVYIFKLWVYDRTRRPGLHGYYGYAEWPVKICNDLK